LKLEKIFNILNILKFIQVNPNCTIPDIKKFLIRDYFDVFRSELPEEELKELENEEIFYKLFKKKDKQKAEKDLYRILKNLSKEGYIYKIPIKKKGSGGAQYKLTTSLKGRQLLTQLKTSKILSTDFPTIESPPLDKRDKEIGLEQILQVYSGELYNTVDVTVEKVLDNLRIKFENLELPNQQFYINIINQAVSKIRKTTGEIAKMFFEIPEVISIHKLELYLDLFLYLHSHKDVKVATLKAHFPEIIHSNLYPLLKAWQKEGIVQKSYLEDSLAGTTNTVYNLSDRGLSLLDLYKSKFSNSIIEQ